jgi:iron complex transport system permease protein
MNRKPLTSSVLLIAVCSALLAISLIVATGIGSVHYRPAEVLTALRDGPNGQSIVDTTVWTLRLPRILLAALVGASLSIAGLAFQTLLRNDLADPYIVGVSAGASVGSELVLVRHGDSWLHGLAAPLAAFCGATSTMAIVYNFGRQSGRIRIETMLLGGVVVGSFLGAISTLILELGNADDAFPIINRLMGTMSEATFDQCALTAVFLVVGFLILLVEARSMNVYALGEEQAAQLGIDTERFKSVMIAVGALLTAISVSVAGIIGFVGLIVPHISRRLCGTPDLRRVLPVTMLVGAILLVWSDAAARSVMPDYRELPVGLITAFLGAPFFLFLLKRRGAGS